MSMTRSGIVRIISSASCNVFTMNSPHGWTDKTTVCEFFATERKNMAALGFGTKAFTLSMLETAMRVSRYEMAAEKVSEI